MPQKLFPATSNKKGHSSLSFLLYYEGRCKRRDFAAGSGKMRLKKYPLFLSVMRKGLFWHYLEKE